MLPNSTHPGRHLFLEWPPTGHGVPMLLHAILFAANDPAPAHNLEKIQGFQ